MKGVGKLTARRVLRALVETGLIARDPPKVVIGPGHLWFLYKVESSVRLTALGHAVAAIDVGTIAAWSDESDARQQV